MWIDNDQVRKLKNYHYNSRDDSISTELLTPWWNYAVNCVSTEIHPNILTLFGFLYVIMSYELSATFELIWIERMICAIFLFIYQTLDAIDGKQARRTGKASPIGELLDHICDNISLSFIVLTTCNLLQIQLSYYRFVAVFLCWLNFILEHFQVLQRPDRTVVFERWTSSGEVISILQLVYLLSYPLSLLGEDILTLIFFPLIIFRTVTEISKIKWNSKPLIFLITFFFLTGLISMKYDCILEHGITGSLLITEIIIIKMSDKPSFHMGFFLLSALLVSYLPSVFVVLIFCYYASLLTEISLRLRIPLF